MQSAGDGDDDALSVGALSDGLLDDGLAGTGLTHEQAQTTLGGVDHENVVDLLLVRKERDGVCGKGQGGNAEVGLDHGVSFGSIVLESRPR